nr:hypothetical protein [Tanacetum cinerariifolium]
ARDETSKPLGRSPTSNLDLPSLIALQAIDLSRWEVGHNTDECMHLKRHIKELIKAGKLSHVIKELKQGSEKDQLKAEKKGETSGKEKSMEILIVQPWQRVVRQRITQSFSSNPEISFPPLGDEDGTKETLGDDEGSVTLSGTSCERSKRMPSGQTKEKKPSTRKEQGNTKRTRKSCERQHNERSPLSHLVVNPNNDAYKGRHQIKMAKEDEKKTTFITSQGIFCYSKMLFEMKNVKATYQCLVYKVFQKQIGRNLDVYMDNLVIKSRMEHEIIRDTKETFKTLREINMKLNSKKSTFGIEEGMFLGYKVNTKGIKVCSNKVEGILSVPSPKHLKEWTMKAEATFKQMKKLLAELPTLTKPMEKKELIVYLVAASHFIVKRPEYDSLVTTIEVKEDLPDPWTLFMDGSSCIDGSGTGLLLTNPEGIEFTYALRFRFDATINEAKYKALIAGLRIAEQMGIKNLQANVDSRLVANQVNGSYIVKESGTIQYLDKVRALTSTFKKFTIKQAHRTMIKSSNEDTPFLLTYGTEAVIPVEIGMPTLRTTKIDMVQNDEASKINLDLFEEKREQAAIREARSKTKMEKYYNLNSVTQALNQEAL